MDFRNINELVSHHLLNTTQKEKHENGLTVLSAFSQSRARHADFFYQIYTKVNKEITSKFS